MNHIGKVFSDIGMAEKIERLGQVLERQRQAGIQDFGWNADCECHECGDTGVNPRNESICWCDAGRKIQIRKDLEAAWSDIAPMIHVKSRIETHPSQRAREIGAYWLEHEADTGRGLVLSGNVGSGKTGLAVGIAHKVYLSGASVRVSTFTEILDEMRPKAFGSDDPTTTPADMYKPHLLVLDDLGTQKVTEFVEERLFAIIDGRYQRQKPTIITTNLDLNQLKERFDKRIVSRVLELNTFVSLSGPDLRMRKARAA